MQSSFLRSILCRYENIPSPYRHPAGRYAPPAGKLACANLKLGVTTRSQNSLTPSAEPPPEQPRVESYEIRLNPVLLLENSEAFIEEVVPHELAHLLVWKHFGRVAPHGKEWKWMMESVLGVPARRTHQFELQSVRRNTFPTAASAVSISLPYAAIIA